MFIFSKFGTFKTSWKSSTLSAVILAALLWFLLPARRSRHACINPVDRNLEPCNSSLPVEYDSLYPYNYCLEHQIPWVASLLETAQYLRFTNSSLVRFGDSEIRFMMGVPHAHAFQQDNATLSERLRSILHSDSKQLAIGLPDVFDGFPKTTKGDTRYWDRHSDYRHWLLRNVRTDKQYLNTHISTVYVTTFGTYCELVPTIYEYLRDIWRGKDVVILRGNNSQVYQYDVFDTANSQRVIYAKGKEVWTDYESLKRLLLAERQDALYIIAIGPTSKVLVYDLVKTGRRALDLGHLAKDYNTYMLKQSVQGFYVDDY